MAHQVSHGGWCPAGRKAEDGPIDAKYHLQETGSSNYRVRTACNARYSDATLIINSGMLEGGTLETLRIAEREGRPVHVVDVDDGAAIEALREWLAEIRPTVLNVAGPRESKRPGIHRAAFALLDKAFA